MWHNESNIESIAFLCWSIICCSLSFFMDGCISIIPLFDFNKSQFRPRRIRTYPKNKTPDNNYLAIVTTNARINYSIYIYYQNKDTLSTHFNQSFYSPMKISMRELHNHKTPTLLKVAFIIMRLYSSHGHQISDIKYYCAIL